MMMDYSDNLLRGISVDEWICDDLVTAAAFQIKFEEPFLRNGCAAQSICWEDDASVIEVMLQQKKDGHFQFRAGIARLQREAIDRIIKQPSFSGILSYDREPLDNNPYHGNVLISPASSKTQRRLLPAVIASNVLDIIYRGLGKKVKSET
ncbi:hypothetical protein ES703_100938 [subsurface metagenome]